MASIKKRPDGAWRARYRDEAGREHARHFERKIDAQRWLDQVTAAVVTGQYVDPKAGRLTFGAFYATWSTRQIWVPGTVKAMDLAASCATFADMPLNRIRPSHVESWVKAMEVKSLQPSTIHTRFVNVRSVFRAAVKDRLIPTDPTDDVTLPRRRKREATMQIPSPEQVGLLLDRAEPQFKAFIALAAFAGMRLGEIAGLQVGDIDFLRRTIDVRRQVQRAAKGSVEIRAPKYGSERALYVPEQLLDALSAHIAAHAAGDEPSRWLFARSDVPSEAADPWHQNTVGFYWRKACKRAAVEGITLHDLRHFYASGLIAAGCDVVTVQRALGHAKATTTLNTYAHLWPTAEDRTRNAAAALYASAVDLSAALSG